MRVKLRGAKEARRQEGKAKHGGASKVRICKAGEGEEDKGKARRGKGRQRQGVTGQGVRV